MKRGQWKGGNLLAMLLILMFVKQAIDLRFFVI
jgi:hypothetical protein